MNNVLWLDNDVGLESADSEPHRYAASGAEPYLDAESIELRVAGIDGNKLCRYFLAIDNEISRNVGPERKYVRLSFPENSNPRVVDRIARDIAFL